MTRTRQATHELGAAGHGMPPPLPPRPNWWLRLASSGWDIFHASVEDREIARRSRLLAWIILGMLFVELVLLPAGLSDSAMLLAVGIAATGTVGAALLNRVGFVTAAGTLLVLLMIAALMGTVTNTPGHLLDTVYLPAYDLLAIAVVIAASVLPRAAAFLVAGLNIALICADFFLQPQADNLLKWVHATGALSLIGRPIALQIIVATVALLWVKGADEAIRRADRAEELAALEHAFAEQRRQLELSVQQILETHVRAANGDYTARAPLSQDNLLWQVAASLNNLLSRLQRSGQADHLLRRTEEELRRLAGAMDDARQGRRPIWPAPSGTLADPIIMRITGGARQLAPPSGLTLPDQSGLGRLAPPPVAPQQPLRALRMHSPPASTAPEMPIGPVPTAPFAHRREPPAVPMRGEPSNVVDDDWPDFLKAAGAGRTSTGDPAPEPTDRTEWPRLEEN